MLLLLGVAVGIVSAALGVGGGILMVPAFVELIPGMDHKTALGTSLTTIVFVAALNAWRINRGHNDGVWSRSMLVAIASIVTGFWSAKLATELSDELLAGVFAVLCGLLAIRTLMLKRPSIFSRPQERLPDRPQPVKSITVGAATGTVSGLTGVGGGGIFVPLALWLKLAPNSRVVGLSNAIMIFTAAAGAAAYFTAAPTIDIDGVIGQVHPMTAVWVFLGAQVGSYLGKWVNNHLTLTRRKIIMSAMLLFIAVRFALRAL
jgi:uncharacterized membrane protein YfcA